MYATAVGPWPAPASAASTPTSTSTSTRGLKRLQVHDTDFDPADQTDTSDKSLGSSNKRQMTLLDNSSDDARTASSDTSAARLITTMWNLDPVVDPSNAAFTILRILSDLFMFTPTPLPLVSSNIKVCY
jgi:hypothetical protein